MLAPQITLAALLLVASSAHGAAPPAADLSPALWFTLDSHAPGPNGTHDFAVADDGCPIGYAECSATTCYPLDGSECCSGPSSSLFIRTKRI